MLLLLKTTQLWLNIYENYFLMPEMFKLHTGTVDIGLMPSLEFDKYSYRYFFLLSSARIRLGRLQKNRKIFF